MNCIHCFKEVGYDTKNTTYSITWRKFAGICTKIVLCKDCKDVYEHCSPTEKEMNVYFKKAKKRSKK